MPAYPHLLTDELDFAAIQSRVDAMVMLGVPYGDAVNGAPELARAQAAQVAASIAQGGGEAGFASKEIVAMVAYMQRLGRDVQGTGGAVGSNAAIPPAVRRRGAP